MNLYLISFTYLRTLNNLRPLKREESKVGIPWCWSCQLPAHSRGTPNSERSGTVSTFQAKPHQPPLHSYDGGHAELSRVPGVHGFKLHVLCEPSTERCLEEKEIGHWASRCHNEKTLRDSGASWHHRKEHTCTHARTHTRAHAHKCTDRAKIGEFTRSFPHHLWGKDHTFFICVPEKRTLLGTQQVPNNTRMSERMSPFSSPSSVCILPTPELLWHQSLLFPVLLTHTTPGTFQGERRPQSPPGITSFSLMSVLQCVCFVILTAGLLVLTSQFPFIWNSPYFPFDTFAHFYLLLKFTLKNIHGGKFILYSAMS